MKCLMFLLLLCFGTCFSQKQLTGNVYVEGIPANDIMVVNTTNQQNVLTKSDGSFTIIATVHDVLLITSLNVEARYIKITNEQFFITPLKIYLTQKIKVLEEVDIKNINAKSIGIITKPVKTYTSAERKLKTAGDFKIWHLVSLLGGSMPLDPIINKISGRTAMLKKELQVEKKESDFEVLKNIVNSDFAITLQLPEDKLEMFLFLAIENPKIISLINEKNERVLKFELIELANKFRSDLNSK